MESWIILKTTLQSSLSVWGESVKLSPVYTPPSWPLSCRWIKTFLGELVRLTLGQLFLTLNYFIQKSGFLVKSKAQRTNIIVHTTQDHACPILSYPSFSGRKINLWKCEQTWEEICLPWYLWVSISIKNHFAGVDKSQNKWWDHTFLPNDCLAILVKLPGEIIIYMTIGINKTAVVLVWNTLTRSVPAGPV